MRKLTYFVAASIDGFIGDESGEAAFFTRFVDQEYLDFLREEYPETLPTHGQRALGLEELPNVRFDTVIQGRASYELALREGVTSPYAQLRQLVASRTLGESPDPAVEIVSADVVGRVRELKAEDGLDIYLCGGSRLAGALRAEIDELVVKSYPVLLGSGMPMLTAEFRLEEFALAGFRSFTNGVVVRTYGREERSIRGTS
ncbi:dihydrofolate reductase family protein [Streptomyces boncukensis]|uniref:Dihydrofolate reductase family protein n=1 Tax=Streptomyces boncukensis TaxID=2711219 RepID=A0A6G4WTK6_9ACTN|nr:dihydrofolate reductase family protein [Streptomyces boncukensis]NGO68606.1 dihydrofolate reductase family protein [Streptomyces boncukensis]